MMAPIPQLNFVCQHKQISLLESHDTPPQPDRFPGTYALCLRQVCDQIDWVGQHLAVLDHFVWVDLH